jgi:hypothetical protein
MRHETHTGHTAQAITFAVGDRVHHIAQRDAVLARWADRTLVAEGTVTGTGRIVTDSAPYAEVRWDDGYVRSYDVAELAHATWS